MSRETKIRDSKRILSDELDWETVQKCFVRWGSEGCIPKSKDYIPLIADEACVEACRWLYGLGIQTLASGANLVDCSSDNSTAYIAINYLTLSEENKKIADDLIQKGMIPDLNRNSENRSNYVFFNIPFTGDMTVGEVSDKLLNFAQLFREQDVLYGRETKEGIRNRDFKDNGDGTTFWELSKSNIPSSEVETTIDELLSSYYQDGEGNYFETEELLQIHRKYVDKHRKR